jgi:hypothetical protein
VSLRVSSNLYYPNITKFIKLGGETPNRSAVADFRLKVGGGEVKVSVAVIAKIGKGVLLLYLLYKR